MDRPNILLITTDQQRADTIHAGGNPIIKTPQLDRIARDGTRFTNAYTPAPVCVPARASLIYGQYPHHTGCTDNDEPMPEDRPSMMRALADTGYRTYGIGKMHFTPDPQALRGFRTRERQEVGSPRRVEEDDYLLFLRANGYDHVHDAFGPLAEMAYIPQPAQMPARLHGTQWVGDRAVRFIREDDGRRPFFLWASFFHPHWPLSPPTPWNKLYRAALMPLPKRPPDAETLRLYSNRQQNRAKYRDQGIDNNLLRTMKAYYYACISFVDFQIGRLLATLEETGRLGNTLIVFASDHGEFLGDYDCFGKRSMLDAAAQVPLIVRSPDRFGAGQVCETPVSLIDIMPTFLAAAGVPLAGYDQDGLDLARVAADEIAFRDRTIYSQFSRGATGVYMALDRHWKYVYSAPDRKEFLFDRTKDPDELRNRAGNGLCRQALAVMRNNLMAHFREQGYSEPLAPDGWRLFPQPTLADDPDAGLSMQRAAWSTSYEAIPGYTDG